MDSSPSKRRRSDEDSDVQPDKRQKQSEINRQFTGCSSFHKNYDLIAKLGEGTFGEVHKARSKSTGTLVALKRILMHNEKEGFPITALREIKILKSLNQTNIIPLVDMAVEPGDIVSRKKAIVYMVTPYMDHDLAGLLSNPSVTFTVSQVKLYLRQLLFGVRYLHEHQIIHRDIKSANLLIDNAGFLKIADFGLARHFYEKPPERDATKMNPALRDYTNHVVTRWYRPPELLLGDRRYTGAVDIWGVGCIFAEMFRRKPIMQGTSDFDQTMLIFQLCGSPTEETMPGYKSLPEGNVDFGEYKPSIHTQFADLGPEGVSLLQQLLNLNHHERITAAAALNHVYFRTRPFTARRKDLPKYESSHESDKQRFRAEQK
ncbi:hypothetical protein CANCADRAFT_22937, partial [Tortispora caseinolytica NRRL Y-17796]